LSQTTREGEPRRGRLLQVLGLAFGLAVIVGNTIGAGILKAPGSIAGHLNSAPLALGVWIVAGIYALLGANSLAELGAMVPRSGGQYVFVRRALGAYPAFVVGWSDWVSTCGSVAAVAMVMGLYCGELWPSLAGKSTSVAGVVVLVFTLMQWRGIRVGDAAQQASSLLKALVFFALIVACFVMPAHFTEPAPASSTVAVGGLVAALVFALQQAIYTYDGWTGVLYFGEEVKNPGREIPRSMIGGVFLLIAIYVLLNAALLHVLGIERMANDPVVAAGRALFGEHGDDVIHAVMVLSLLSSVNALILMASRVPVAMSRDRLVPAALSNVNPGGTPTAALFASAGVGLAFLLTGTFERVVGLLSFFFVASYTLSFTSVFVLRRNEPDTARPFRAWGHPWTTGLALAVSVAFLASSIRTDWDNSWKSLVALAASYPAYAAVQYMQSKSGKAP
jgi:APA family basic amino acid/polyamine antiporter